MLIFIKIAPKYFIFNKNISLMPRSKLFLPILLNCMIFFPSRMRNDSRSLNNTHPDTDPEGLVTMYPNIGKIRNQENSKELSEKLTKKIGISRILRKN